MPSTAPGTDLTGTEKRQRKHRQTHRKAGTGWTDGETTDPVHYVELNREVGYCVQKNKEAWLLHAGEQRGVVIACR